MIPVRLQLSGFLSYQDRVEIDFNAFELACISGSNGAGKSTLLDAITWVLFGQARRRDDAIINTRSNAAEVILDFDYEGNRYRIQRSKPRDKSTILEFFVLNAEGVWRALTEHSLRETEARIEHTLRLDYETFTNASFFLQGKADQFAQQRPGDRKRILTNILGLEIWENFREETANRRKLAERELDSITGQIQEIETELAEEQNRRDRLAQLETELERLAELRKTTEASLENLKRLAASLEEQRRLVEILTTQHQAAIQRRDQRASQLAERLDESQRYHLQLESADAIERAYSTWLQQRQELEQWDKLAAQFQEHQNRRSQPLTLIEAERTRLEEERRSLLQRQTETSTQLELLPGLEQQLNQFFAETDRIRALLDERASLNQQYLSLSDRLGELNAENKRLREEMNTLKERIERLKGSEEDTCPLCGQPLGSAERYTLLVGLEEQGKTLGDRFRMNQALMQEGQSNQNSNKTRLDSLAQLDEELRQNQQRIAAHDARLESIRQVSQVWESGFAPRLAELEVSLAAGNFAVDARAALAEIDAQLKQLGYDPAAHEQLRHAEQQSRPIDEQMRLLETARAALGPLEREIEGLKNSLAADDAEIEKQQSAYQQAQDKYLADAANQPDLDSLERDVFNLKTQENQLRMQVGGARQSVEVLTTLRDRLQGHTARRGEINKLITRYKALERAFGKDGVPALLIEQALPEIESQANEFLDRLSNGSMSVRFSTQREYKDKNRDDKRETLDILISDPAGMREYEMFSGGEAFRVNFAIRLALSRVLARRAGARLQTLVIDEGFGSQDSDGRQRLIEAINLVRSDFAKILVITHLEELKDSFPARIEVEKTPTGSVARVWVA